MSLSLRYRIASFVSGFALMAYELAGARILTPVVGSSTYVWTSIIGVIIAALSLGYYLGGRYADKRGKTTDIAFLLLACAALVLATLFAADFALTVIDLPGDLRLQAVLISLILFAPASILLGAVSPYLARMHTKTLSETGRSIAMLSALNSIGGIIGTFIVGFVFFGYIGSRETLIIIAALLAMSGFLLMVDVALKHKLIIAVLSVAAGAFTLLATNTQWNVVASIETPTSSYLVQDILYNNDPVRVLTMGPGGFQSGVYKNGSKEPVFSYTQKIAALVDEQGPPTRILMLGGGTFTLPEYFALQYPQAHIDAVEIDPKLEEIATEYFGYGSPANVTIFAEDARTFVRTADQQYDVIITDAYGDTGIPFSLVTAEFAQEIHRLLAPDGILLMNVIAGSNQSCKPLLHSILASFSRDMTGVVMPATPGQSLDWRQNLIFAFTHSERAARLDTFDSHTFDISRAQAFTDNYAPIERLNQSCART